MGAQTKGAKSEPKESHVMTALNLGRAQVVVIIIGGDNFLL